MSLAITLVITNRLSKKIGEVGWNVDELNESSLAGEEKNNDSLSLLCYPINR